MKACADIILSFGEAPPVGAHIVTPRHGYTHHGIYVDCGRVVQYSGSSRGLRSGPVEEVTLEHFTSGQPVWIRCAQSPCFDAAEVVRRARSRIGENRYRLLSNNCEHFCEWCLRGEHRSYQVDDLFSHPWRAFQQLPQILQTRYGHSTLLFPRRLPLLARARVPMPDRLPPAG